MEHIQMKTALWRVGLFTTLIAAFIWLSYINNGSLSLTTAMILLIAGLCIYALTPWFMAAKSYRTELWYKAGTDRLHDKVQIALARKKLDTLEKKFAGAFSDEYDVYNFARVRKALAEANSLTPLGLKLGYFGHLMFKREVQTFISLLEDDLPQATKELKASGTTVPGEPKERYNTLHAYFHGYLGNKDMDEPETRTPRADILTKGYLKLTA